MRKVTKPDMERVMRAATLLRRTNAGETGFSHDWPWNLDADRAELADAFLYYFDETPLTVEALVRGCTVDTQTFGHRTLFFRGFHVRLAEKWEWFLSSMEPIPAELQPRTVGDLRQLIYRLERDEVK